MFQHYHRRANKNAAPALAIMIVWFFGEGDYIIEFGGSFGWGGGLIGLAIVAS